MFGEFLSDIPWAVFKVFKKIKAWPIIYCKLENLCLGSWPQEQFPCGNFYGFCYCSCCGQCHLGLPGRGLHGCAHHRNMEGHCRAICCGSQERESEEEEAGLAFGKNMVDWKAKVLPSIHPSIHPLPLFLFPVWASVWNRNHNILLVS